MIFFSTSLRFSLSLLFPIIVDTCTNCAQLPVRMWVCFPCISVILLHAFCTACARKLTANSPTLSPLPLSSLLFLFPSFLVYAAPEEDGNGDERTCPLISCPKPNNCQWEMKKDRLGCVTSCGKSPHPNHPLPPPLSSRSAATYKTEYLPHAPACVYVHVHVHCSDHFRIHCSWTSPRVLFLLLTFFLFPFFFIHLLLSLSLSLSLPLALALPPSLPLS